LIIHAARGRRRGWLFPTIFASAWLRRRAIEIDGLYCDTIIRRWQEMTGGEAVLDETGETFVSVEGQRLRDGGEL